MLSASVSALDNPIDIIPRWQEIIESEPRHPVTAIFQIRNNSTERLILTSTLNLPNGWKQLIQDSPLVFEPDQSGIKILNFFIPQEAEVGLYKIDYIVKEEGIEEPTGLFRFDVRVLPSIRFELKLKRAPPYKIAGEEIEAVFVMQNNSNTDLFMDLDITSAYDFDYEIVDLPEKKIHLDIGESKEITIRVQTRQVVSRLIPYRLGVKAKLDAAGGLRTLEGIKSLVNAYCDVEIFPRASVEKPNFHTLPIEITLGHSETIGGAWRGDARAAISGKGTLDEEGKHHIDFQISKTLDFPEPDFFNYKDRYSLKYWTDRVDLYAGDHNYSVSRLIENYRFGRGVLSRIKMHQISFGGFYHYTPFSDPFDQYMAGFIDFYLFDSFYADEYTYKANLNSYSKVNENLFVGLYQEFRPSRQVNLELEVAAGSPFEEAIYWSGLFKGRLEHEWLDSAVSLIIAQPNYPGNFTDRYYLSADFDFKLLENAWKIDTGYSQEQSNLLFDEGLDTAPFTWNYYLGTSYLWKTSQTYLSSKWNIKSHFDRLSSPDFDELNNTFGLTFRQPVHLFDFDANANWDIQYNKFLSAYALNQHYTTSVGFTPNSISRYRVHFAFDKFDSEYLIYGTRQFLWGGGAYYKFRQADWNFNFTNSYYFQNESYQGYDIHIASNFGYRFNKNHELSAAVWYKLPQITSSSSSDFFFALEYTAHLNMPISRIKKTGALKGYVYDKKTEQPLKDIIIRIADRVVITSAKGQFGISALKPGEYILEIDTNRTGLNLIPDHKTPIKVIIKSGETSNIKIGVVESAVIEGRVTLFAAPEKLQRLLTPSDTIDRKEYREEDLVIDSGFSKVLIEIRMNGETRRTISDNNGFFTFYDVRPGLWTLEANKASLPPYHYYKEGQSTIDVRPDETKKVDIKIFPHKRPLTSIQEGGLLTVEKPEDEPTIEKADFIATLTEEEYQKVTDTLERIKLTNREYIPKLLGLDWAISYDMAEKVLLEKEKNFENLSHVSKLTLLDTRSTEAAEIHDLESLPIIKYFSRGINHYNLSGLTILSFYNPIKHQDHLYLSKVEIHLTAEDKHGETVDIESVFSELGHLFVAKWSIIMDDAAKKDLSRLSEYEVLVKDILISYKLVLDDNKIIISYQHNSLRRLIEKSIEIRK